MIINLEQAEKSLTDSYKKSILVLNKTKKFCSELTSSGLMLQYADGTQYDYQALMPGNKAKATYKFAWRTRYLYRNDDYTLSIVVRQSTVEYVYGNIELTKVKTKNLIIPAEVKTFIDQHKADLKPSYRV